MMFVKFAIIIFSPGFIALLTINVVKIPTSISIQEIIIEKIFAFRMEPVAGDPGPARFQHSVRPCRLRSLSDG